MTIHFVILSLLFVTSTAVAKDKSDHHGHHGQTKSLGAHEHGAVKLELAVVGKTIDIDIDGPAESFLGFEYIPKTTKEIKTFQKAESLWTKDLLTKLFVLDKKLGCLSSDVSFKQSIEETVSKSTKKESGVHSEIEAKAIITCIQDLTGQNVLVSVKKYYPHVKKLSIDVMGSETKSYKARTTEEIKL